MNDRPKNRMKDAGIAAGLALAIMAASAIPPLEFLLFPGLLIAAIFFPTGIHSDHALLFVLFFYIFNFLIWSGLAFALIRLFRKFRRR